MYKHNALAAIIISVLAFLAAFPGAAFAMANLIPNASLETETAGKPDGWHFYHFGSGSFTSTYPVQGADGTSTKAASIEATGVPAGTGNGASWSFSLVSVVPGKVYTFSDKYEASVETEVDAYYKVAAADAEPRECTPDTDPAYADCHETLARSVPASPAFRTFTTAIAPPRGTVAMTVLHLLTRDGSLAVDDYSLYPGVAPANQYPQGIVSLTFDNGFEDTYANVLPILENAPNGPMHGTFYLIPNVMNTTTPPGYLTTAQMLQLQAAGNDIASHTADHCDLVALNEDPASAMATGTPGAPGVGCPNRALSAATTSVAEIRNSQAELKAMGAQPDDNLAYPYGSYDQAIEAQVRDAGFKGARTVDFGFNTKATDPYRLTMQEVTPNTSLSDIASRIDAALASKSWLILLFHQVDATNTPAEIYATTPEILRQTVGRLAQEGACVLTVSQVLSGDTSCPPSTAAKSAADPTASVPNLSDIAVSNISTSSATVAWKTDEPATSQVLFGTAPNYSASSTLDSTATTTHRVMLSGLSPATLYHFSVQSGLASTTASTTYSIASSSDMTFSTAAASSTVPLAVTGITADRPTATPDGTFADGWQWTMHFTVPTAENAFHIAFSDWTGAGTLAAADNMRVFSPQSSNAMSESTAISATDNGFGDWLYLDADAATSTPGRQVNLVVQVRVPPGTVPGQYSTTFTAQSRPASATSTPQ